MWRVWAGLLLVAGCGRFGFGRQELRDADASIDADIATAPDAFVFCHTGTWSTPQSLALNTLSHESDPTVTADGLTMFYTTNRTTSPLYRIWTASRMTTSEPFSNAMIVAELQGPGDDQDPAISPDGLTIYFDSDRGANQDLYVATRSSRTQPFEMPMPVVINGEPQPIRRTPAISPDGRDLYYASGLDIAHATRATTSDDFTFVRLLAEVNAPATDGTPVVSGDGLELFFETFRNGPAELFRSTRQSTLDTWSMPVSQTEIAALVPSATGIGGPELSADGRTLYLFANSGQIDIYETTRTCD